MHKYFKPRSNFFGVGKAAIPYPDLPAKMNDIGFSPFRGPFRYNDLKKVDLGDVFIDYLKNWKNFIID